MMFEALAPVLEVRTGTPWCLFLDRDGVINTRIMDGYVRKWSEFEFIPGTLAALRTLSQWAPHIVVVTNQQGVGKGLMPLADLADIHDQMRAAVAEAGGRIDAVQFCPHLSREMCDCRKPNIGMANEYLAAHPDIDASLSVMVGDTESDIEMGRRLASATGGCFTVRIGEGHDLSADATYPNLAGFADAVAQSLGQAAPADGHTVE